MKKFKILGMITMISMITATNIYCTKAMENYYKNVKFCESKKSTDKVDVANFKNELEKTILVPIKSFSENTSNQFTVISEELKNVLDYEKNIINYENVFKKDNFLNEIVKLKNKLIDLNETVENFIDKIGEEFKTEKVERMINNYLKIVEDEKLKFLHYSEYKSEKLTNIYKNFVNKNYSGISFENFMEAIDFSELFFIELPQYLGIFKERKMNKDLKTLIKILQNTEKDINIQKAEDKEYIDEIYKEKIKKQVEEDTKEIKNKSIRMNIDFIYSFIDNFSFDIKTIKYTVKEMKFFIDNLVL